MEAGGWGKKMPLRIRNSRRLLLAVSIVVSLISSASVRAEFEPAVAEDGTRFGAFTEPARSTVYSAGRAQAGGINVAIVASAANDVSAPWFTDPQNILVSSGAFASVAVINAGAVTPSTTELGLYDAVLVWSNMSFDDPAALGDNLADYVDGGGSVVVAVFANSSTSAGRALTGRWQTGDYEIIPAAGGTTTGSAAKGLTDIPGHPIMAGVNSFAGGTSSFRPTTTDLAAEAIRIAAWSDGSTLVAIRHDKAGQRVDLGFYPPSDLVQSDFWDSTTNGDDLLVNALSFAADPPDVPTTSQWGLTCLALTILCGATAILRQRQVYLP